MATRPGLAYLSSYRWKPSFQGWLRPWAGRLARAGITANALTIAAMVLSSATGLLLSAYSGRALLWVALPAVLLLRMAWNAMDGMLAREHGQASTLGMYLNELGDVVSDAFLLLPFAFVAGVSGWGIAAAMLLTALTEMAGVLAAAHGAGRRYDGPFGKSDRAIVLGAAALWIGAAGGLPAIAAYGFAPLLCLLLIVTLVNRVRMAVSAEGENR